MKFEGTYVAMVTPFDKDQNIDEEGFRSNINYLIDQGVDGLVGAGTTGESATLTHDEHQKVIEILVDEVDGRVQTVAGTGSNSTSEAISLTKFSADAGVDAALLITPYYNKPQQHALVNHYSTVAGACDIPIIAYNVPSRTGSDIAVETAVELAKIEGVDALKEASGSVDKVSDIYRALCREGLEDDLDILSGEDSLTLPLMAVGATGPVISLQFLIESVLISVTGGLLGVIVGVGATTAVAAIGMPSSVPAWSIYVSFIVCVCIGVLFGYIPAQKAANMNPIEAIRHE